MNDTERTQKEASSRESFQPREVPGGSATGGKGRTAQTLGLGVFLGVVGIALVTLLMSVWPAAERATMQPDTPEGQPAEGAEPTVEMSFLGLVDVDVTGGTALLILVAVLGALGSFIHAGTSFVEYVGNEQLARSWTWWYILRVPIGASLALILYVAFRGGLFSTSATSGVVNIYGVGALAALAGLFSKQATNKLEDVFSALFRVPDGKGDDRLKDSLAHERPTVTAAEPPRLVSGQRTTLIVRGTGFVATSQVRLKRVATGEALEVKTTFIDATRLSIVLEADDVTDAGTLEIVVVTPPPGGGTSVPLLLDIGPSENGGTVEPEPEPAPAPTPTPQPEPSPETAAPASEAEATADLGAEPPPTDPAPTPPEPEPPPRDV